MVEVGQLVLVNVQGKPGAGKSDSVIAALQKRQRNAARSYFECVSTSGFLMRESEEVRQQILDGQFVADDIVIPRLMNRIEECRQRSHLIAIDKLCSVRQIEALAEHYPHARRYTLDLQVEDDVALHRMMTRARADAHNSQLRLDKHNTCAAEMYTAVHRHTLVVELDGNVPIPHVQEQVATFIAHIHLSHLLHADLVGHEV